MLIMLPITIRKRTVSEADIPLIQGVINEHWAKGRKSISNIMCQLWGWFQANGAAKEDTPILHKPRVRNGKRAATLAQMTTIVILLKRAFSFVVKTTARFRKYLQEANSETKLELLLRPPPVPTFILKLIQRE